MYQSTLFSSKSPALSGNLVNQEPNLLVYYQNLTDLRERTYPTPVSSSPPHRRKKIPICNPLYHPALLKMEENKNRIIHDGHSPEAQSR